MPLNNYSSFTKAQLVAILQKAETDKHYGLVWEEERVPEKVVQDCINKIPILSEVKNKSLKSKNNNPENILIEGDNFHALTTLTKTHKASIDLIYIDPPYNTGKKEDFMYNDKYVDIDDSYRHSKWLSFMHKRLMSWLPACLIKKVPFLYLLTIMK